MKKFAAEGVLLFITLIWGATFVIIKTALQDLSPMLFVTIRFTLASLIFLPFLKKILKELNKATLAGGLVLGLFYFLGFSTQTAGLQYTSATKSAFITGSFVIFIPFWQVIIEKKIPGKGSVLGIVLVVLGLLFLSSKGKSLLEVFYELGSDFNIGDFLTILCALFYAAYIVYLDSISKKHSYLPLVFIQIGLTGILGALTLVFFSVAGIEKIKFTFNEYIIFAFLYTSILATVLASTLQTKFQKFTTPSKAGIIISFEPIFSSVFAYLILHETISFFGFIGCILIFTGLLASELLSTQNEQLSG
ncbi:MAG TPA: DMT family transporter [Ignavibacteriaceae bacterium]|nr:DMT family transporter [Ignavibacteriaceae bacterium]